MTRGTTVWNSWKRFAQRAAEAQAQVLFFLLYFIAIVPMSVLRLSNREVLAHRAEGIPRWRPRDRTPVTRASARRQF